MHPFDLRGNTTNRVDQNANVVTSAYYNAYGARGSTNYDDDPYDGFGGKYGYRSMEQSVNRTLTKIV